MPLETSGPQGYTVRLLFFMAMIAAMKKVLSPISESRIIPHDLTKACKPEDKVGAAADCMGVLERRAPNKTITHH